jgi:hypothetical protein
MIGGIDVPLHSRAGDASLEVATRAIRQRWPVAVFEDGITGDRYNQFWQIPFGNIEEIFVYRDSTSADAWDDLGAVPELENTMIHILSDADQVTVVVDTRDSAMNEIISAIESGLQDSVFYIPAELEAA